MVRPSRCRGATAPRGWCCTSSHTGRWVSSPVSPADGRTFVWLFCSTPRASSVVRSVPTNSHPRTVTSVCESGSHRGPGRTAAFATGGDAERLRLGRGRTLVVSHLTAGGQPLARAVGRFDGYARWGVGRAAARSSTARQRGIRDGNGVGCHVRRRRRGAYAWPTTGAHRRRGRALQRGVQPSRRRRGDGGDDRRLRVREHLAARRRAPRGPGPVRGVGGVLRRVAHAHFDAEDVIATGDRCVVQWRYTWKRRRHRMGSAASTCCECATERSPRSSPT